MFLATKFFFEAVSIHMIKMFKENVSSQIMAYDSVNSCFGDGMRAHFNLAYV